MYNGMLLDEKNQHNRGTPKNIFCVSRRIKIDQKGRQLIFHKNRGAVEDKGKGNVGLGLLVFDH